jgi:hypothetical protein
MQPEERITRAEWCTILGQALFDGTPPVPRCAPSEPPVLTPEEEGAMHEKMVLFRSND